MKTVTVVRWKRFGHDRLYVNDDDGNRLGWADLNRHQVEVDRESDRELVEAAIRANDAWLTPPGDPPTGLDHAPDGALGSTTSKAAEAGSVPTTATTEAAWVDLALNRPGQAAREQARHLRKEAPVRTLLCRLLGIHTDERAWRIGADGEQRVGRRLARLGDAWHVLHAVPVGTRGSDIDHIVIGPGGVFTINTKHHPDAQIWVGGETLMVNGTKVPYVRNARFEAERASRLLSAAAGVQVPVTGVIAVLCERLTVRSAPHPGVEVITANDLRRWIAAFGKSLSPEMVDRIYARARRSTTWSTDAGVPPARAA